MIKIESLLQVLEQLQSARLAAKLLIGAALFAVLLAFYHELALGMVRALETAPAVLYAVLFLVCFAVAVLLVEALLFAGRGIVARYRRSKLREARALAEKARTEEQRSNLQHILPNLSEHYHSVLQTLTSQPSADFLRTGELYYLEKAGAILLVAETSRSHAIYRLHPGVEDIILDYCSQATERAIAEAISNLTHLEREFLQLFAEANPSDPQAPAHPFLSHACHTGAQSLRSKGLIEFVATKDVCETVELSSTVASHLVRMGVVPRVSRQQLRIDLGLVAASGTSGSGAHST